jgi:zeaxanthin glucosyltransferase
MSHIGIFSPAAPGHIYPMSCLGRTLQARGHRITYFHLADCEEAVRRAGLDFRLYGERDFPAGTLPSVHAGLGELDGSAAMRFAVRWFAREAAVALRELPRAMREERIDQALVDQTSPGAIAAAEHCRVPYVVVSNAMVLNHEAAVPPFFTHWNYSTSPMALLRNRLAYAALERITAPVLDCVNRQRREWKLPEFRPSRPYPLRYPHIAQQPACFDFPRRDLPGTFHYTGPFHDSRVRPAAEFPWERLTGRPLIYASMGTLQNRLRHVFHAIAAACQGLDADLVISLGGGGLPQQFGTLPGDPIVVEFAPQLELLASAALTITHAGLNTALETLAAGVPAVAIPVGNDQPGVAARLKYVGAGEFLPVRQVRPDALRPIVERVYTEPQYRERARALRDQIRAADGLRRAAEIVETAVV